MGRKKSFEKSEKDDKNIMEEISEKVVEEIIKEPEESVVENNEESIEEIVIKKGKLKNCNLLNARKEPVKNSEIVFVISQNDEIKIIDEIDGFYNVEVNGKKAYSLKDFIEVE